MLPVPMEACPWLHVFDKRAFLLRLKVHCLVSDQ